MAHSIRKRTSPAGPPLAVVRRRIETLRPDPANPRSHSPKQIRQLTRSIGAFGFDVPILVDRTLRIIAGQGRLLAAQELGWREVPTVLLDQISETHRWMSIGAQVICAKQTQRKTGRTPFRSDLEKNAKSTASATPADFGR